MIMLEKRTVNEEGEYIPEEENTGNGLNATIEDEIPNLTSAPSLKKNGKSRQNSVPPKPVNEISIKKEAKVSIDINDDLGL